MAPQVLRKEDFNSPWLLTAEDLDWSTLRSPVIGSLQNIYNGTNAIETPTVISSPPQQRRVRIKETEVEWWLGSVTEIEEDGFTGKLEDLAGNVSIVEFSNAIISQTEQTLLCEGATFTYSISAIDNPTSRSGGREYKTKLAFSGKKRWTKAYEQKAKKLAESVFPEGWLE